MSEISPDRELWYDLFMKKNYPIKNISWIEMLTMVLAFFIELTFFICYLSTVEICVTTDKNKAVQHVR